VTSAGAGQVATLSELLERAARRHPERGVALFDRRGRACERRRYPELLAAARLAAGRWAALGVEPGDRVLACLPTSWSLVDAWTGALLRGAWPVAVAPGAVLGSSTAHVRHLEDAVDGLRPRWLLCGGRLAGQLAATPAGRVVLPVERLAATAPADRWQPAAAAPEDVAFLQLTSGSTGRKRAVMIPHAAALHNVRASDEAIGAPRGGPASTWARSMVSWLPLHHDMGLVGTFLFSIACGFDLELMPPDAFLARPHAWLRQLGARGPSLAATPTFGLGLCVERASGEALSGVDLSGWRAAMVGAEMVSGEAARAFAEAFAPNGLPPETLRACYGLAEATLTVTCDRRGQGVRTRPLPASAPAEGLLGLAEVASTGEPVQDTEVAIAAPDGRRVAPGTVGEVLVRGPGVFAGYHDDAEQTASALRDGWLWTGDLGFLDDGELYLVGRRKEILVVHGENVMPHEIEWLAESVSGSGGACRAGAFSIGTGGAGEEVVVVLEVASRDAQRDAALERAVRERVGGELSLPLADVVLVRRGGVPRTTSGKVQRNELRRLYLEGRLGAAGA
jgi:acyl-CoA synthetase (AMP-forming)/AMP-acid ligase II